MSWEDGENPFLPKVSRFAAIGGRLASQKGDIHPVMLNGGNVVCWPTFRKIEANEGVFRLIGLQQVDKEARGQRRKDAYPHHAYLTAPCSAGIFQGVFDAAESHAGMVQEFTARIG